MFATALGTREVSSASSASSVGEMVLSPLGVSASAVGVHLPSGSSAGEVSAALPAGFVAADWLVLLDGLIELRPCTKSRWRCG